MVGPADSTLTYIRKKVRRLTALPGESALPTAQLDEYINNFYNQDFPNSIKTDQLRSVYTFFTQPNVDRYPVNVNYSQGFRSPVYVEGVEGVLYKDRESFYQLYPRSPTKNQFSTQTSGTVTGATQANPGVITSTAHGLTTNDQVTFSNIGGMTELNGNTYTITVVDANSFSIGVDTTTFTAYTGGGNWTSSVQIFSVTVTQVPLLRKEVVVAFQDVSGTSRAVNDDGMGNLILWTPFAQTDIPGANVSPNTFYPGQHNLNTGNPGDLQGINVGLVNYSTGLLSFDFTSSGVLPSGSFSNTIWTNYYTTGRPYSLLFWNNELVVRPVPDNVYKVEVENYLTPVQFLSTTDNPLLNQWAKYISYGAALDILYDRQDVEGVENLRMPFEEQKGLVLERQATEEIGVQNSTIFNTTYNFPGYPNYNGWM